MVLSMPRFVIIVTAVAACSTSESPAPGPSNAPLSLGIVAGVVQDTAGHEIPNAVVCAATAFTVSGTPTLVVREASTNRNGAYLVPIDLAIKVDVRAGLTVAARLLPGAAWHLGTSRETRSSSRQRFHRRRRPTSPW